MFEHPFHLTYFDLAFLPHPDPVEREFFVDNLLVLIHFVIEIIWWTGLAPWEFEFPFPGSLASTFLARPCKWLQNLTMHTLVKGNQP